MKRLTAARDKSSILMRRFGGMLFDTIFVGGLVLVVNVNLPPTVHDTYQHAGGLIALGLALSYFVVAEAAWGATPGKLIFRIRVIRPSGEPPGFWKASIRTLLRLIEVNPVLFGGVPAYLVFRFSKRGQRAGDLLAGTYVVRTGDAELIRQGSLSVESLTPHS